ncbi:MAG: hypothetical protein ACREGE_04315 [Candidatus Microsaccharimonas sp.]
MSNQEIAYTSTAEKSPFLNETSYFAHRDPKFLEEELFLDDIVTYGQTEEAIPLEKSYLARLERLTYANEGLAQVAFKAIAVAQYARQINVAPRTHKDSTYKNIGLLLEKTIAEKNRLKYGPSGEQYRRHAGITGLLAEMAVFTALSYDSQLKHPLTGRPRTAPAHHILPSSVHEDRGEWRSPGERDSLDNLTGFDLKVFTPDESTPVIPLQVKNSLLYNKKNYAPGVTIIPLDEIAAVDERNDSVLPAMLRDEALGRRTRASRLQLSATNRILDSLIQFKS